MEQTVGRGGFDHDGRHLRRMNAERANPQAAVDYAYLSEVYSSPRFDMLPASLRAQQLSAIVLYFVRLLRSCIRRGEMLSVGLFLARKPLR